MENPPVSVIVNTYNRGEHLRRLLDALARQEYDNYEIVVINGPSTDNTKKIIQQYKEVIRVGKCPVVNLGVSRNIGIRMAAGDILAFIDDDAMPQDTHWIRNAVSCFDDEKVGIVSGTVYYPGNQVAFRYGWFDIWGENNGIQASPVVYDDPKGERFSCGQGCNVFFRAKAVAEAGGFDEYFIFYLEESDLGMRIIQKGYTCRYGENMAVVHEAAPGPNRKDSFHENLFVIGRSQSYFVLKATKDSSKSREEREEIARHSMKPRMEMLEWCAKVKYISQDEYKELTGAIRDGLEQGIKDSKNERKLDFSIRPDRTRFKKFDKSVSVGHGSYCILCDSTKEDIQECTRSQIKDLQEKGNHVYVIIRGERTKLELIDGVNYCTVHTEQRDKLYNSIEFFLIRQELRNTFDVQNMLIPILTAPFFAGCFFSSDKLLVIGNAVKSDGIIRLFETGIQYGPYIVLMKGTYEVTYTGNNLHEIYDYRVTTDYGKRIIHHDMIENSNHIMRYSFFIDERMDNIEFVVYNHKEMPVEIFGIEVKQVSIY